MAEDEAESPEAQPETTETPPSEDAPASPAPLVEPKPGWTAFVQAQHLRPAAQAGFRRWLSEHRHDAHGHYDRATWEGWLKAALAHEAR